MGTSYIKVGVMYKDCVVVVVGGNEFRLDADAAKTLGDKLLSASAHAKGLCDEVYAWPTPKTDTEAA